MNVRDPIRLEIFKNALESIADGMALTIVRTSRSTIVRSCLDFSTGVLDGNGELVGQGACLPMHLGGMMPALKACLDRYDGDVNPGDILVSNDPYEGGSHLPDIFLYKPVFVGGIITGYMCAMAQHTDIGGRVAGGNACDSTEIYQEGLRIPPLKLYREGVPDETLFRILEKAVRLPDKVLGDLTAQITALDYGQSGWIKLVERFGVEGFSSAIEELLDYTEELTRQALLTLPNGTWSFTDYIDDDGFGVGPIPIVTTLTKEGDALYADFTGTGPQAKGAINPVKATSEGMVYAALKTALGALGAEIPNTSGYFRPVTMHMPAGSFINPNPPAPVAARSMGCIRLFQSIMGAFAQMLPQAIPACSGGSEYGSGISGYDKSKTPWKPWIQMDFANETAIGGFSYKDGTDAQGCYNTNLANIPVEEIEAEQPLLVEEYALVPDTEGAGMYRGGLGMSRKYRYLLDETLVQMRADREEHTPYGLFGGEPSAPTEIDVQTGDQVKRMPTKFLATFDAGDTLRIQWPGAGGWGNPLERSPELLLDDVIEEKITVGRARSVYGVVIDDVARTVDQEQTHSLRHGTPGKNSKG